LLLWAALLASAMVAVLVACRPEAEPAAPEIRPVRAVTIEKRDTSVPVVLTGSIQAEDQAPLAFRIGGRMIERTVNLGDRVRAGQVVARLDTQNERNAARTARANLTAAQGQLTHARSVLQRREPLAARGAVAKTELDQAREGVQTAEAAVDAAEAQLSGRHAREQTGGRHQGPRVQRRARRPGSSPSTQQPRHPGAVRADR
jgi:multidrug efflux pump subunit AcrA (membrane-fusion protein)